MPNFKKMYITLAGEIASTIEVLDQLSEELKQTQQEMEERYIADEGPDLVVLDIPPQETDPE